MAFTNISKSIAANPQGFATGDSFYRANAVAIPLRYSPLLTGVVHANIPDEPSVIRVDGRNSFSIIAYQTVGQAAPVGLALQIWGSHSNLPGSWVKVGNDITAVGETLFTGYYQYIAIHVDALTSGSLELDFVAVKD